MRLRSARNARHAEKLSRRFLVRTGISRKTGYKWVERDDAGGLVALIDPSRAPVKT
jgi:hypothetical protein